jgi:hypothetical protein
MKQLAPSHTGKFVVVAVPQYLRAAKSYALPAFSSLSYPPINIAEFVSFTYLQQEQEKYKK